MNSPGPRRTTPRALAPDVERWLEGLPAAVLGLDAGERVRFVNAAAAEMFAAAGRSLLGKRLDEVFGADAPLTVLARRALANNARIQETDIALNGAGFTLGRAGVIAAPIGEHGYVALVLTPAQRQRPLPGSASSAARTLAHEVRNPLAGIRAAAQLIGRGGDAETNALAKLICDEVDRIGRLTNRIDPLGAIEPRLERFNIHEALERVRKLIGSSAPRVLIRERYDPSLPAVRGDLDQLIQALLNIAKNAVEAMVGQPEPELSFATSYQPGVRFRAAGASQARAQLEIRIIDNGPGLDPTITERLFEPFATTKSGGMGLGLTVAAEIIARHDGRIEVDSQAGRTVFKILLPTDPEDDAT